MAIVWQRQGEMTEKDPILVPTNKGYLQHIGYRKVVLGSNTLAYNTETGIVGTIQYHRRNRMWVLEISRCKNIQNMTHCISIVTEQSQDRIELIAALKEAVEQSLEALLMAS